jgi:hypothetical protein
MRFLIPPKREQNLLRKLGPLYHEYGFFGVRNEQRSATFTLNQMAKAPVITAHIAMALSKSRTDACRDVSFAELFCADGYYAMVASRLGANPCTGIDNDKTGHFATADAIAKSLGIGNVKFIKADISADSDFPKTDVVANVGGLYHVEDPLGVLAMSFEMAAKFLVIQTVVSMAADSEDYYENPAPGWTWGNRFSRRSFNKAVRRLGGEVIDEHFNELLGNEAPKDRGSVYYLIRKP